MSLKQRLDEIGKVYLLRDDKGVSAQASLEPPLLSFSLADSLLPNGSATAPPLAIVVGSGITGPARRETPPSRFFGNTLSTGAGLVVLIAIFGPLSGAHLDPAVTLVFAVRRELAWPVALAYIAAQIVGAVLGAWLAMPCSLNRCFKYQPRIEAGGRRASQAVATFGLIGTILGFGSGSGRRPHRGWLAVHNRCRLVHRVHFFRQPGVTLREPFNTFAGIAPTSVPLFIAAQACWRGWRADPIRRLLKDRPANGR